MDNALAIVKSSRGVFYRIIEGTPTDGAMGEVDFRTNTITVMAGLPFQRFERVVWHELIHVELRESGDLLSIEMDEVVTEALAHSIPELIGENLHLLRMESWWKGRYEQDEVGFEPDWDDGPYDGSWVPPDDDGGGGRPVRLVVIQGGKDSA